MQGRYQEAADYYLSREIGDREGEGHTLARLGVVDLRLGRYQDAARYLQHALALFREMGHTGSEAEILLRLGDAYLGLGRYDQAAGDFERALAIFREIGAPEAEEIRTQLALTGGGEDKPEGEPPYVRIKRI